MKYQVFRAMIEIPLNHLKDEENIHSIHAIHGGNV